MGGPGGGGCGVGVGYGVVGETNAVYTRISCTYSVLLTCDFFSAFIVIYKPQHGTKRDSLCIENQS